MARPSEPGSSGEPATTAGAVRAPGPHVVMAVRNACVHDARVRREAATLAWAGYRVTVVAVQTGGLPAVEKHHGWTVVRRLRVPLYLAASSRRSRRGVWNLAWKAVWSARYHLGLWRAIRALSPDVVHAHDLDTLPGAVAATRAARVPLVYDAHELFTEMTTVSGTGRRVGRLVERAGIRQASRVVTVNRSIARELAQRYHVAEPVVVRNCPLDPGRLVQDGRLRSCLGLTDLTPLILYHGGFSPGRGLKTLIRAVRQVPGVALVLMGWGPLESELSELCQRLGIADRVHVLAPVPPETLLQTVAGADLGVVPYLPVSLNNRLALPNKVFEFLAAGVPVVASNLPEVAVVLRETGGGEVFPAGDAQALADLLVSLVRAPERLEAFRRAAARSRPVVTWEPEARKLLHLYRSLIPPPPYSDTGTRLPLVCEVGSRNMVGIP